MRGSEGETVVAEVVVGWCWEDKAAAAAAGPVPAEPGVPVPKPPLLLGVPPLLGVPDSSGGKAEASSTVWLPCDFLLFLLLLLLLSPPFFFLPLGCPLLLLLLLPCLSEFLLR